MFAKINEISEIYKKTEKIVLDIDSCVKIIKDPTINKTQN
jgi:hypothetical protein